MSATLLETAPAKINLTLRVLGRRADGFHQLESLVAFADVADTLTLQPDAEDGLEVTGPFAGSSGPAAENLVLKALVAARKHIAGLNAGHFLLEKKIPVAAGLGGGSADAAAALRLVARTNGLGVDDPRLMAVALAIGADVPVCFGSRARIMRGVGELLSEPIELPVLPAVLVNPRVPLATRDVFGKLAVARSGSDLADVPREFDALIEFLKEHGNDLTPAANACAPVVGEMLGALHALPSVRLARMSGSGPTCFAVFGSQREAATAAQKLKDYRKDWWIQSATIGPAP
ncbi:MAG: 4-(cytidine 5'-diphospho)-2-C-methyl-D-erythritol kinase [Pseudolabrys sp.]